MDVQTSVAEMALFASLDDSRRLSAVFDAAVLLDQNVTFLDDLTRLIQVTLDVPIALVSLVTDKRQIFKSAKGLPESVREQREMPLSHSFCQHVVISGAPLLISDALNTQLVCDNLAIRDLGARAYLGTPILDTGGHILGSLCSIDTKTREWSDRDLLVLEGFSRLITAELSARSILSHDVRRITSRLSQITDHAGVMLAEFDRDFRYIFVNRPYAKMFGATAGQFFGEEMKSVLGVTAVADAKPIMHAALNGETIEYDLQVEDSGGQRSYLCIKYAPQFDENEVVCSVFATITDKTAEEIAQMKVSRSRQRLAAAHDLSPDGFMVFRAIRDENLDITDFTFEYANDAGAKIAGRSVDELIGGGLLDILPGNKDEGLFDGYVSVVETGDPFKTTVYYAHEGIDLWIRVSAIKLDDGFAVSFSDVTERKKTEIAVTENAGRLQRILDNVLAFVGILDAEGILKDANQPALDAAGVAREDVIGRPFWETYWWSQNLKTQADLRTAVEAAKGGQVSRYDVEIRAAEGQTLWIDFQLTPLVNDDGSVSEIIPSAVDISARKESDNHRELLVGELNHRVKNSLATIQAMARQTIRSASCMEEFEKTFSARLSAISAAHDIVMREDQGRALLQTMIERQIGPYTSDLSAQVQLSGQDVPLGGPSAHAIGLVLHELATNSAKYGALSVPHGLIEISWQEAAEGLIDLRWEEKSGPAVSPPKRQGFGSRLINQSLEYSLGGKADLEFARDGLIAKLQFPKEAIHG